MTLAKDVLVKLKNIKMKTKTTDKEKLLKEYLKDDFFKKVVVFALDDSRVFNIRNLPRPQYRPQKPKLDEIFELLEELALTNGATKEQKQYLSNLCYNEDYDDLVRRIIRKDLKCGIRQRLVNKVCPDLLFIMPYMRCSLLDKSAEISFPAMVQRKEDGLFANIIKYPDRVKILSRNGKVMVIPSDRFNSEILELFPKADEPLVFMGELLYLEPDGTFADRKKGNGLVNKASENNKTMTPEIADRVRFVCWDVVTETEFSEGLSKTVYDKRLDRLSTIQENEQIERSFVVETFIVNSMDEAREYALEVIDEGGEGAVLKDGNSIWKDGTSRHWVKLKKGSLGIENECECELRVIGWDFGKRDTDFSTCLGSLICESEDGKLITNVGSGLSWKDRCFGGYDENNNPIPTDEKEIHEFIEKTYMDKIITVRFNEVIQDKKMSKPRLFLPRFIEIRDDKNKADTLKYIEAL